MTTAQVVETSVTVNNNSPIQDYVNPDDQTQPTFEISNIVQNGRPILLIAVKESKGKGIGGVLECCLSLTSPGEAINTSSESTL